MGLGGFDYAHMCRDDHVQIGHNDSTHERCPMCRLRDTLDHLHMHAVEGPTAAWVMIPKVEYEQAMERAGFSKAER